MHLYALIVLQVFLKCVNKGDFLVRKKKWAVLTYHLKSSHTKYTKPTLHRGDFT